MKKLLLIALFFTAPLQASRVKQLKDTIITIKNDRDASIRKAAELTDSIGYISAINSDLTIVNHSLKQDNMILHELLKEYRDRFEQAMRDLIDVTARLVYTERSLDAMMDIPQQLCEE